MGCRMASWDKAYDEQMIVRFCVLLGGLVWAPVMIVLLCVRTPTWVDAHAHNVNNQCAFWA